MRLADPYWSKLVAAGYRYEPELTRLLQHVGCDRLDLVDAGEPISALGRHRRGLFPAGPRGGCRAQPADGGQLRSECGAAGFAGGGGGGGVDGLNSPSPAHMSQLPGGRAGASAAVRENRLGTVSVDVPAKTLDQLVGEAGLGGRPLLVKLDVEASGLDPRDG